jgi:cytochrome c-type biogenesis protein CcmH/NrfG
LRLTWRPALCYEGSADGALDQLRQSLQYDPKDAKGAEAAWEQMLKSNPQLAEAERTEVKKSIAQAKQQRSTN